MSTHRNGRPIEILLVEDNPADVRLTIEVFKDSRITNHISVAMDGEEAMDFLHKRGKYAGEMRPDLVLLDLNLPKKDGREVLTEIKADQELKTIPIIVLTTSDADQDVWKAYDAGVNSYITKPVDLEQFIGIFRSIEDFWLTIVKLPTR
ncbi:MAG TPA: response regulator [Nitrospirota bacterium]|nr:response regulator [Nitrospirota bacterium]